MGSQWLGMGRDLLELPVCAMTMEKYHAILKEKGLDLKYIITTDDHSVSACILQLLCWHCSNSGVNIVLTASFCAKYKY
jgi:hypothetical protein